MNATRISARAVWLPTIVAGLAACAAVGAEPEAPVFAAVKIVGDEAAKKIDVLVDGKPFTTYQQPEHVYKPILHPLRTAKGTIVTRGFPLEPRPGERDDHPHHVGCWLNYGDVNGLDFWNHSDAVDAKALAHMGTIRHRKTTRAAGGDDKGELVAEADWLKPDGSVLLTEATTFVFRGTANLRAFDRTTTLTAREEKIVFHDNKEGMFGIRVARGLEHPSKDPATFTDANGKPTTVKVLDNTGVTGMYTSSEGKTGDAVWGTRGRWVMLAGKVEGEDVTLAILDHPKNSGAPTYWHARGYGLFAANPLGQKVFSNGKEVMNFTIEPGQSAIFRYRVVILSGTGTPAWMEEQYKDFTGGQ